MYVCASVFLTQQGGEEGGGEKAAENYRGRRKQLAKYQDMSGRRAKKEEKKRQSLFFFRGVKMSESERESRSESEILVGSHCYPFSVDHAIRERRKHQRSRKVSERIVEGNVF